ncbi:hypothetical protein [Aquimarina sp. MMG016]|uniref:hypothetical protein n=1 Tax=Aquimarina sp. MMG016 TaxID=2822690 RepID=UPI001B3A59F2|nr:hypothetical protein [Aquimarina sp. MMG016]MBQ4821324.1 hypothetical protein [Aquimarina sp. MMG016]
MKNNFLLFIVFLISFSVTCQVSVGPKHVGKPGKFDKEQLEKFKESKTIFVFSTLFERSVYEDVLKESWDVTPYEIVSAEDFDLKNYLKEGYSIGSLGFNKVTKMRKSNSWVDYLYMYFEFSMFDNEKLLENLNKYKGKRLKKINKVINKYKYSFARFELFPKSNFVDLAKRSNLEKITESLFTEDVFYNYQPGILRNYFQKINDLLKKEEIYWMYKDDYDPELKKLTDKPLFFPEYITMGYYPKIKVFSKKKNDDKDLDENDPFSNYKFISKSISNSDLNNRILSGEEFYYLRYVRVNSQKFIEVVNSKTGKVIYRNYATGLARSLKPKHLKHLSEVIEKSAKN